MQRLDGMYFNQFTSFTTGRNDVVRKKYINERKVKLQKSIIGPSLLSDTIFS
jgi:hypothetical protein